MQIKHLNKTLVRQSNLISLKDFSEEGALKI